MDSVCALCVEGQGQTGGLTADRAHAGTVLPPQARTRHVTLAGLFTRRISALLTFVSALASTRTLMVAAALSVTNTEFMNFFSMANCLIRGNSGLRLFMGLSVGQDNSPQDLSQYLLAL